MRAWVFGILVWLTACSTFPWDPLTGSERDALRHLDLVERESARGRDLFAAPGSQAGAWQVRCAWDPIARQGACVQKTRIGGTVDVLIAPDAGYLAIVTAALSSATLPDGPPGEPRCVTLSSGRRACVWMGDTARLVVTGLRESKPLRIAYRTAMGGAASVETTLEERIPAAGYPDAERALLAEQRIMRERQNQFMSGGGGGGAM